MILMAELQCERVLVFWRSTPVAKQVLDMCDIDCEVILRFICYELSHFWLRCPVWAWPLDSCLEIPNLFWIETRPIMGYDTNSARPQCNIYSHTSEINLSDRRCVHVLWTFHRKSQYFAFEYLFSWSFTTLFSARWSVFPVIQFGSKDNFYFSRLWELYIF